MDYRYESEKLIKYLNFSEAKRLSIYQRLGSEGLYTNEVVACTPIKIRGANLWNGPVEIIALPLTP